ncbi:MAG: hypothetical protein GF317_19325 [Candidatus Lokiarchaeota archaeon]|nr:hypothetical protein [Candidatus Lokiarchaeota archaeon]MBD3201650.1 hypothetical protein [Candidatus Lokiarchaeota archaeon]
MTDIDILFIHPPRNFEHLVDNMKKRSSFLLMPMGLFSMADLLDRNGYNSKIVNYSLEKTLHPKFSILKFIKKDHPKVIGVDLHWVQHSAGALDLLKIIKRNFPSVFTLLGGFTASYYAKEIMQKYKFIDGIIQGEAELPIIELLNNIKHLEKVPNLIYRKNQKIYDNGINYILDDLDQLNFTNVDYLVHWKEYIKYINKVMHTPWPLEIARGCQFNCVNCGGSFHSCKIITRRNRVIFRSPERVVDDIRRLVEKTGYNGVFYGHGVYRATEKYFMKIHEKLRDEKIRIHSDLEIWRLPISDTFFRDYFKTYDVEESMIWFSVRSFSENYRKKFHTRFGELDKSFDFTNDDLNKLINKMDKYNIPLRLFWDVGNPFENKIDFLKNYLYALKLVFKNISKYKKLSMWSEPIIISPGCAIELKNETFGIQMTTKTFEDYVRLNRESEMKIAPLDVGVNFRTSTLSKATIDIFNKLMFFINLISVITV